MFMCRGMPRRVEGKGMGFNFFSMLCGLWTLQGMHLKMQVMDVQRGGVTIEENPRSDGSLPQDFRKGCFGASMVADSQFFWGLGLSNGSKGEFRFQVVDPGGEQIEHTTMIDQSWQIIYIGEFCHGGGRD